jgi:hypothetical protein
MKKINNYVRTLAIAVCLLAGSTLMHAQQGQTGVGVRLGTDPGITVKHFVRENGAIEGILHTGYRGLLITGLYEWHTPLSEPAGFKFYAGLGGHLGVFDHYVHVHHHYYHHHYDDVVYSDTHASFGPDGIIGLEYDFTEIPLNMGLDIKPAIDFHYGHAHTYVDGALSIRVLF